MTQRGMCTISPEFKELHGAFSFEGSITTGKHGFVGVGPEEDHQVEKRKRDFGVT